ncbi:MAG: hypothetical protein OEY34_06850, partial [Cyclobacteriaceae bacterium]|nr:hypothetical protein [Cyclobacteriaceae bacterium]
MRIFSLSILFFVITHPLLSQVTFEKGYFINNNNDTVKCLIKNYEWKNNPFEFTFKENESSQPQLAPVYNVRFFEIYGKSKYIRSEVNIDRSDSKLNTLSKSSSPEWSYEMLFLKVIIDSDYSLYSYHQNNFTRFFYSTPDIPITQLVYKKYELSGVVAFNN